MNFPHCLSASNPYFVSLYTLYITKPRIYSRSICRSRLCHGYIPNIVQFLYTQSSYTAILLEGILAEIPGSHLELKYRSISSSTWVGSSNCPVCNHVLMLSAFYQSIICFNGFVLTSRGSLTLAPVLCDSYIAMISSNAALPSLPLE